MIATLYIVLIILALIQGFWKSHFLNFGLQLINPKYPYFKLGLTFEGSTVTNDKRDVYHKEDLIIGLLFINIWVSFYIHLGNDNPIDTTTAIL